MALIAAGMVAFGMSSSAHAALTLTFSDNLGNSVTYTDAATPGSITVPFGTMVGGFDISGTATAPPAPGTSSPTTMGVLQNSLDVKSTATGATLTITETSTGGNFTPPAGAVTLSTAYAPTRLEGSSTVSVTASGTGGSASITESLSGTGLVPPGSLPPIPVVAFSPGVATGPFTVTNVITFTPSFTGAVFNESLSTSLSSVPEPASLAMAFSVLPLAGIALLRRRSAKA